MSRKLRFRILWTLLAVTIIVSGLITSTPYLINTNLVKNQISRQISDWMGLPVRVRGEPVVTVFPFITFKLRDVQIASHLGADQPNLMSMKQLRAEMFWLPVLLGKFEVRRFHLIEPQFEFVRKADGQVSWDMTDGSLVSSDPSDGRLKLSEISLGTFRIYEGTARVRDFQTGWDEHFEKINLGFDWPSTGKTAALNGSLTWRTQPVEISAQSDKPLELLGGNLSPLSLDIRSPMFSASLEGSAATMEQLQLEGDFAFETESLRTMLDWIGLPLPTGSGFGPASISARSNLVGASVAFSDMQVKLDDNEADGALQVDFRRDRPLIQGTLASGQLDLGAYFYSFGRKGALLDASLSAENLLQADLDIRLSTDNLSIEPLKLGRTAASLVTRNRQLALSISESYAYGGRLEASLDMRPSKHDPARMYGHLRTKANGFLAGTFAKELAGTEFVSGTTLMELDFEAEGMTAREMLKDASGSVSMVVTDGHFERFNLDVLQDALLDEDAETATEHTEGLYEGGTSFDVLSIRAGLDDDAISVDEFRLTAGKRGVRGDAYVTLPDLALEFPGVLYLYDSADPTTHATDETAERYPFRLTGPLAKPVLSQPELADKSSGQMPRDAIETPEENAVEMGLPLDSGTNKEQEPDSSSLEPSTSSPEQKNVSEAKDKPKPEQDLSVGAEPKTLQEAIGNAVNEVLQQNDANDMLAPKKDF